MKELQISHLAPKAEKTVFLAVSISSDNSFLYECSQMRVFFSYNMGGVWNSLRTKTHFPSPEPSIPANPTEFLTSSKVNEMDYGNARKRLSLLNPKPFHRYKSSEK